MAAGNDNEALEGLLRRYNRTAEDDDGRENIVREMLALSDNESDVDPFDDGDDEDADPNYVPVAELADAMRWESDLEDAGDDDDGEDGLVFDDEIETGDDVGELVQADEYFLAASNRKWYKESTAAPLLTRTPAHNVFKPGGQLGPVRETRACPIDHIFYRLFNARIRTDIIKWTNEKAKSVFDRLNATHVKKREWKPLTSSELDAFFGCLLFIGAMRDGHRRLRTLWDPIEGHVYLRAVMSRGRFELINSFLRFDDSIGRRGQNSAQRDLLAPVNLLVTEINKALHENYIPDVDVTIDEQLKAFRGRCKFRQYMPSKPAKYGLKFWWLNESKTGYPLRCAIYTGSADVNLGFGRGYDVVMGLMPKYLNTGRCLTVDNFFVSIDLAQKLLEKKTTLLGTIRKNKRDVPKAFVVKELLDANNQPIKLNNKKTYRPITSSFFGFSDRMTLVSYVPKANKQVVLLSTQHSTAEIVETRSKKPQMIIDYNKTKGGVDVFDQMVSVYSCSRQTNRWPMVVFYNLLDVAALASTIIYRATNPPTTNKKLYRHDKLIELSKHLMRQELELRAIADRNSLGPSAISALRVLKKIQDDPIRVSADRLARKQVTFWPFFFRARTHVILSFYIFADTMRTLPTIQGQEDKSFVRCVQQSNML